MIMKRIIFALTTALMLCTLAQGKNRTVTENDSLGNKQRVIELKDTVIDGKAVSDSSSSIIRSKTEPLKAMINPIMQEPSFRKRMQKNESAQ